jgi:hypothetical protein
MSMCFALTWNKSDLRSRPKNDKFSMMQSLSANLPFSVLGCCEWRSIK